MAIRELFMSRADSPNTAQVRLNKISPAYWRVIFNNPPLNLMGPEFVLELRAILSTLESDEQVKVVVFESAVASFDKWSISNTKRLVNAASLPSDVEIAAGWDACLASIARPTTPARLKAFRELGFQKPGDAEDRLGFYLGRLGR
jgi:hypothetical protein